MRMHDPMCIQLCACAHAHSTHVRMCVAEHAANIVSQNTTRMPRQHQDRM